MKSRERRLLKKEEPRKTAKKEPDINESGGRLFIPILTSTSGLSFFVVFAAPESSTHARIVDRHGSLDEQDLGLDAELLRQPMAPFGGVEPIRGLTIVPEMQARADRAVAIEVVLANEPRNGSVRGGAYPRRDPSPFRAQRPQATGNESQQ
jgi:hypothetical protein